MSFLFDIIIIAIIAFTIYRGVSKGFVKSVMGLVSLLAAFFAAYYFSDALAEIYNEHVFSGLFVDRVSEAISPVIQKTGEIFDLEKLFNDMPEVFSDLLARYGTDVEELKAAYGSFGDASAQTLENMTEAIAEPIARSISAAIAFLTVFVIALIVLAVLTWVIDLIFKLPILKSANKFLGFLLGCVCAFVYAYLFSELSVAVINAGIAFKPELFNENIINNSILLKYLANLSLFALI